MKMRIAFGTLVLLAFSVTGFAKTWEDKEHQIALEVDEGAGWKLAGANPEKKILLVADLPGDPPALSFILLWAPLPPSQDSIDSQFIVNFEAGHLQSIKDAGATATKLSSRRLEIDGMPAYESIFLLEMVGKKMHQVLRVTMANSRMYMLIGQGTSLDPKNDKVLLPLMDSLKFTAKPRLQPADQPKPDERSSGIVDETSSSYKMGYLVGRILVGLLVLAFLLSLLRRLIKKSKS